MAINKQTIISAFDDKLTLLQWLKTINKALDEAVLTGVEVRQKGNATFSFVVTFEDGTELVSNDFVLAQGESINGATIRNGHLYLSLTNGDELDAGNLKPVTSFEINTSQHLIVNYGDGTSQDLGAIFSGNVNIDGNFTANSIIENMAGYSFEMSTATGLTIQYAGIVKNGNKITYVISGSYVKQAGKSYIEIGSFNNPKNIYQKLVQSTITNAIDNRIIGLVKSTSNIVNCYGTIAKTSSSTGKISFSIYGINNLTDNDAYDFRYEVTFLLSDNLAGN